MAQNPKYDNDVVNLGYLNKRLGQTEESINKNNSSISQLPKNYSIPPNPPYYKDSLLCYKNKIYKCNTTKLSGVFSWNDWTIAATDDTTLSDFINNTYELEKLEIQEQIDGKVQTYYQEMDPSNEWTTDLEKSKHIGDYWYNTTNNTQWRYNQNTTTTPITYGWGQVNVPNSVFDLIDKKKSIYTIKPTSYKIDDLWIIEDTLSDEDLPTGTEDNPIAKGDWVFSVADSDTYNKEHWIKRDEDISLSYLEQHYYTIGDIDSSFEELERNTDSKITKAKEEISLNVSQKYTTIEEHNAAINDFDEQIGAINDTITTHETNISNLNVGVGKISASVESIESKTEELSVDIDGVKENIIPTSTVSGSNIHIEDASDKKMVNFEIEGKSEQATRSGKNLFNINTATLNSCLKWADGTYSTENLSVASDFIKIEKGKSYISKYKMQIILFNENKEYIGYYNNTTGQYNGFTISTDSECNYVKVSFRSSSNNNVDFTTIGDIQLEEGTTATEYEPYGVSPSPDYPSEIESVGYENLFDKDNTTYKNGYYKGDNGEEISTNYSGYITSYVSVQPNTIYTISGKLKGITNTGAVYFYDNLKNWISRLSNANLNEGEFTFTTPNNCYYMQFQYIMSVYDASTIQITKGTKIYNYIPYGKYGIEVKTVGKNLFDGIYQNAIVGGDGVYNISNSTRTAIIKIKPNTNYSIKKFTNTGIGTRFIIVESSTLLAPGQAGTVKYNSNSGIQYSYTSGANANYLYVYVTNDTSNIPYLMVVESNIIPTTYEPYKSVSSLFQLDQPLRSLPNGVKDELVIENGRAKIIKRIGKIVLDGSENWYMDKELINTVRFYTSEILTNKAKNAQPILSNYFITATSVNNINNDDNESAYVLNTTQPAIRINKSIANTLTTFKNWLSTHNTQVDYELAKPYTEEVGEVEMPSTYKGTTYIQTTDNLEPNLNITYVRDTVISDYVENHVAELKITESEIKSSVETVSSSVDGLNSTVNRVEEITNDNSQVLNIISTNIDRTSGEVREVTTTTGFTFNAEGMAIADGSGFKAQHTAQGTFYKDGDSITGQYTKDGSKQKDLELFGTYSYGKNDINDTPMFVAQLYIDEKGEECFGHFFNI